MSNKIYLARMMTQDSAEIFEKAIQGENVKVCPKVNQEASYERVKFSYKESLANISDKAREKLEANVKESEDEHVFFMFGDDLNETMGNLSICAHQVQSEDAIKRVEEGSPVREDFLARNFVAICVFEVPEEVFQDWVDLGLVGINDSNENYETLEGERVTLPEAGLGNEAMKRALDSGYLTHFGQSHEVYKAIGMEETDFDKFDVFDRGFIPNNPVGLEKAKKQNENNLDSNPYEGTDLEQVYWHIMKSSMSDFKKKELIGTLEYANGLSGSDRNFIINTIFDVLTQDKSM